MGLYNFHALFVDHILSGSRRHTIRLRRKHPDKPGSTLHLYTGLGHPGARLLARVRCTNVWPISISALGEVRIDGRTLDPGEREYLARADGFDNWPSMFAYWRDSKQLPFDGQILFWNPP
jgi:hypothetical protein